MRAVIQRVSSAEVRVNDIATGSIQAGLLVLLGVHSTDDSKDISWLVDKIIHLRIFDDSTGKMNLSLRDTGGSMLVVSQFTLYGDCQKGRRPSWSQAAPPEPAKELYERFIAAVRQEGIAVQTGQFQAMMQVTLTNDGPVTIILDSPSDRQ